MPPAAAGTSASLHLWQEPAVPPHTPPPFFVIPYSLRSKRTAPATGRGLEPNGAPGFFLCPKSALPFQPIRTFPDQRRHPGGCLLLVCTTGFPKTALPESMPQSGTPKLFPIPSSLAPLRPSRPASRERQRSALSRGGGGSGPRQQYGTAKHPFPRTAPHAGHRLILNPCRRAALRNYSLFSILSSLAPLRPSPPPSRERQRAALRRGGGSVPRRQCGTAKRPFPPHSPACRAQAHSEPVPQSGTPQLFTFLYSLFTLPALLPFPSGTDSKTKIYFVFFHLTHNSARYNIGLNLIMEGKEYGKTGSA